MHFDDPPAPGPSDAPDTRPWYRGLTRYHWFVLIVAALGWLFDTMDQQLFNLARKPAVTELLGVSAGDPATAGKVAEYGGYATIDLHDRLGDRRPRVRHPGRQDRPGQDDAADDPALLGLHRPERPLGRASGTSPSTGS